MKKSLLLFVLLFVSAQSFAQFNLQLLGHLSFNTTCAGVWHHVDSQGNEYALIGAGDGLAIVDVTDPANPVLKFNVPAASSLWREVKTFGNYAYATTEGGGGVTIVNLQYLPDSVQSKVYTGDGAIAGQLGSAHTCAVDDEGYLHIFGSDINNGGDLICNLNNDSWNPEYVGMYDLEYIHDGFIRNDTLWAGEIYAGQFSVIDVSDRTNPQLLATQQTPGQFCHNTWLNDDHTVVYTTDEVTGAPLAAYDITDVNNIQLLSIYFTDSMPNEEVHNVRVIDDFLVNPSYGSQITIVDAARPGNLVEIANYPTGQYLCWDASPYLPSGNIIATDVGGGLYVFAPYYVRACYLEGVVTDSITNLPINGATVKILASPKQTQTDITGNYKTGLADPGTFDIEFSKTGYITKTVTGVTLSSGVLTQLDVELVQFVFSGQVIEAGSGNPIQNAKVKVRCGGLEVDLLTNASGNFTTSAITSGNTEVTAGLWGYTTQCINIFTPNVTSVTLTLPTGIYDDFTFDYNWTVTGNAVTGLWERGEPVGTLFTGAPVNPDLDAADDCSIECFVTDNAGGGFNDHDVDDGFTQLASPVFDLTSFTDPYLNYQRWFKELGGNGTNADTLFIRLSNGTNTVDVEAVRYTNPGGGTWISNSLQVSGFIIPTSTMQFIAFIQDRVGTGNPLECGIDKFFISDGPVGISEHGSQNNGVILFPNPVFEGHHLILRGSNISSVEIVDNAGRMVLTKNYPVLGGERLIDIQSLKKGIYVVRIISKEGITTKKLVKM